MVLVPESGKKNSVQHQILRWEIQLPGYLFSCHKCGDFGPISVNMSASPVVLRQTDTAGRLHSKITSRTLPMLHLVTPTEVEQAVASIVSSSPPACVYTRYFGQNQALDLEERLASWILYITNYALPVVCGLHLYIRRSLFHEFHSDTMEHCHCHYDGTN